MNCRSRWTGGLAGGLALLLAGCGTSGPPPLGDPASGDSGLQCTPGKTLADGLYTLHNMSGTTVTVTRVRLVGGAGQEITSPAYLMPAVPPARLTTPLRSCGPVSSSGHSPLRACWPSRLAHSGPASGTGRSETQSTGSVPGSPSA